MFKGSEKDCKADFRHCTTVRKTRTEVPVAQFGKEPNIVVSVVELGKLYM